MKFVALALALLLAVGPHAASMQTDVPAGPPFPKLDAFSTFMDAKLAVFEQSLVKSLEVLSDSHPQQKETWKPEIENTFKRINAFRQNSKATIEQTLGMIQSFIKPLFDKIKKDLEDEELQRSIEELLTVIENHKKEYYSKINPMKEDLKQCVQTVKEKYAPELPAMIELLVANADETATKAIPIVMMFMDILKQNADSVMGQVTPYWEESKMYLTRIYEHLKGMSDTDWQTLNTKFETEYAKIQSSMEEMTKAITDAIIPSQ